uniref:Uncharacterized protein n=1 Tax=Monopterus albus TaxID=43700 RepID=A0A3Q3J3X7_MONAL
MITQLEALTRQAEKTHPIIQCIIEHNRSRLGELLQTNDINGLYPCRECDDYITPLIAAVINHEEKIFNFLLQQGADPNIHSQKGWTPLHYVSISKAPLVFVKILLEAKANPNAQNRIYRVTPLQIAAMNERGDVMKELISAVFNV